MSTKTTLDASEIVAKLIDFLHLGEKLKCTLRHDWTSTGRQESVAEHSWRLALMVMLVAPHLDEPIDLERALKMAIVHDIAEVITGDVPYFDAPEGSKARENKKQEEQAAIEYISKSLGDLGLELKSLWMEYEENKSVVARVVKGLDKIEAQLQQNASGAFRWEKVEREDALGGRLYKYSFFDCFLNKLAGLIVDESRSIYQSYKDNA